MTRPLLRDALLKRALAHASAAVASAMANNHEAASAHLDVSIDCIAKAESLDEFGRPRLVVISNTGGN